jgi:hypothetical protein
MLQKVALGVPPREDCLKNWFGQQWFALSNHLFEVV